MRHLILFLSFFLLCFHAKSDDFILSDGRQFVGAKVVRISSDMVVIETNSGLQTFHLALLPQNEQQKYLSALKYEGLQLNTEGPPVTGAFPFSDQIKVKQGILDSVYFDVDHQVASLSLIRVSEVSHPVYIHVYVLNGNGVTLWSTSQQWPLKAPGGLVKNFRDKDITSLGVQFIPEFPDVLQFSSLNTKPDITPKWVVVVMK